MRLAMARIRAHPTIPGSVIIDVTTIREHRLLCNVLKDGEEPPPTVVAGRLTREQYGIPRLTLKVAEKRP